jgi:hypothetical protein
MTWDHWKGDLFNVRIQKATNSADLVQKYLAVVTGTHLYQEEGNCTSITTSKHKVRRLGILKCAFEINLRKHN